MRPAPRVGGVGAGIDPARPPTIPLRPLRFRELLDEPFALIQANIRPLSALAGATLVLAVLGVLGTTGLVSHLTDGSDAGTGWAVVLATAAFGWLSRLVLRGVSIAVSVADLSGTPTDLRSGIRTAAHHGGPLVIAQIMFSLIGIGVLTVGSLLIITYPLALIWLSNLRARRFVVEPTIIAEHTGYRAAVARSKDLVEGAAWTIGGLWLTQRLLFGVLAVPAFGIPFFLSDFSGTHRWAFITLVVGGVLLVVTVAEIVEATSRVLCYVDRRCVREGLDIHIPGESR
ncbi:hypothetical protein [Nocardia caishijiensis]|uniref:Uncharacterized protein n=1 Tax=Nocardia caishijiensis TaxID=184756 RepID=A0ABQ6YUU4_9NOCA|nr:hypothetical protein [Nocardia caishijiensis]KAF0849564.1 hypothetical protein FNL39_1011006 [Nocardia caishijiensis]